jgi:nucleoside-diphosphate-sugar epimerase
LGYNQEARSAAIAKNTWLVTGGAGFIGSNFILTQFSQNPHHAIVNLDKLTYAGNPQNLSPGGSAQRIWPIPPAADPGEQVQIMTNAFAGAAIGRDTGCLVS